MSVPGYVIRTFLTIVGQIMKEERIAGPHLVRYILKYKNNRRLPGTDLLTPKVVQYLCNQKISDLWERIVEAEKPVITPCPEDERLPIWN